MLVKKRSSRKNWLKLLFIPAIFGGIIYLLFYSPIFAIAKIEISGEGISEDQVHKSLGESVLGSNIILWQPKNEGDYGKLFSIEKDYLARVIRVNIFERKREIIWCYVPQAECFWIDRSGLIFDPAPISKGNLLRVVNDYSVYDEVKGVGDDALPADFAVHLFGILESLDKLNLATEEVKMENYKHRELIAVLNDGPQIVFSLSLDPGFAEPAIRQFKNSDSWQKIKKINLTVDGRAYASF